MAKNKTEAVMGFQPMRTLHGLGIRSNHAYTAGAVVLGLTILTTLFMSPESRRARLGSVLAPTLFVVGLGLKAEE